MSLKQGDFWICPHCRRAFSTDIALRTHMGAFHGFVAQRPPLRKAA